MFIEGGALYMSILTLLLALLFLAAWKAPAWVRSIGTIALALSIMLHLFGLYQAFEDIVNYGGVSQTVFLAGYRCSIIIVIYGFFIFIISRIIHICQTPRI